MISTKQTRRLRKRAERVILYRRTLRVWADDMFARGSCIDIVRGYNGSDFTTRISEPMFRRKRKDLYASLERDYGPWAAAYAALLVEDHDHEEIR